MRQARHQHVLSWAAVMQGSFLERSLQQTYPSLPAVRMRLLCERIRRSWLAAELSIAQGRTACRGAGCARRRDLIEFDDLQGRQGRSAQLGLTRVETTCFGAFGAFVRHPVGVSWKKMDVERERKVKRPSAR